MKKTLLGVLAAVCVAVVVASTHVPARAQAPAPDGPQYTADGRLVRPLDYREWVFVTSGLGMTYGPAQPAAGRPPLFDNVFVTRAAYREFMRTGTWPDKTMFILELRAADENVSINNGGRTQGTMRAMEAAVKDVQRFPEGGWGYFSFDGTSGLADSASPLPSTASCYACHKNSTAVDNTFVQFYPTLMDVARKMGTIKPTYDPNRKP
jgi:hypothetical protein